MGEEGRGDEGSCCSRGLYRSRSRDTQSQSPRTAQGNSDLEVELSKIYQRGESQSLRTAQGNSDITGTSRSFYWRSRRNPSVQLRAIRTSSSPWDTPAYTNQRRNPSVQLRAIRTKDETDDPQPLEKSQSLRTAQGNSDDRHLIAARVTAPESQSLRTAQGNSDRSRPNGRSRGRKHRNPSVQLRAIRTFLDRSRGNVIYVFVAIPPYSSGQFGLRASQALDSRPLSRPFWITSEIRLAFHLRTSTFHLAPLRLHAWIHWGYGPSDNLPVKMAFRAWHDSWRARPLRPSATLVKELEGSGYTTLSSYTTRNGAVLLRGIRGRRPVLLTTACPRGVWEVADDVAATETPHRGFPGASLLWVGDRS
jgi:hypothetical protein